MILSGQIYRFQKGLYRILLVDEIEVLVDYWDINTKTWFFGESKIAIFGFFMILVAKCQLIGF